MDKSFISIGPRLAMKLPPFEKHLTEYLDWQEEVNRYFIFHYANKP